MSPPRGPARPRAVRPPGDILRLRASSRRRTACCPRARGTSPALRRARPAARKGSLSRGRAARQSAPPSGTATGCRPRTVSRARPAAGPEEGAAEPPRGPAPADHRKAFPGLQTGAKRLQILRQAYSAPVRSQRRRARSRPSSAPPAASSASPKSLSKLCHLVVRAPPAGRSPRSAGTPPRRAARHRWPGGAGRQVRPWAVASSSTPQPRQLRQPARRRAP
jgi:hypothetical protein